MQIATNPQTGEKVQWNGSAWVPMGGAPAQPAPAQPAQPLSSGVAQPFTIGTKRPPSLPSGYEPNPDKPGALMPIPGGPADPTKDQGNIGASNLSGADYLKTLDAPTANMVKALSEGRKSFPSGSALRAPYWQNMLAHVSNYDPGFDEVNYTGRSATRRDFTSGKAANNIRALNTAIGHLGHLEEQIGGTASHGGFPLATAVNAVENTALRSMGDAGPTNFDTTVSALAGELTAVYRGAGGAEADIQRYIDQLSPNASKDQKEGAIRNIVGLLKSRLDALNDQYRQGMGTTAQQLQLLDPQAQLIVQHLGGFDAAGAPQGPGGQQPPQGPGAPPQAPPGGDTTGNALVPSTDGFNDTPDPQSASFWEAAAKQGMPYGVAMRAWAQTVKQTGNRVVTPPPPKAYHDVVAYMRDNPSQEFHPFSSVTRTPVDSLDQATTAAAFSPAGSLVGNAANGLAAGIPTAAAGDQGQYFQTVSHQQNPVASTVGDLAGTTAGMMAGEAALGRIAGMESGTLRQLIANGGYGAVRGASENPEDRTAGAINGGLAGVGGTLAGNALVKGVGAAIGPSGGSLNDLYAAGVRPTPGQRFVNSGVVGRAVNGIEEGMGSIPLVGAAVRGARQESRDQFQTGAFNQALGELRGIKGMPAQLPKGVNLGTKAQAFTQQVFDRAYDSARSNLRVAGDAQMKDDLTGLSEQVSQLAQPSIDRFNTILENQVLRRIQNAGGKSLEGADYKTVQAELGKVVRGIRKSPSGDGELADALDELSHVLDSAARRHSDPGAVEMLDKVDRGYAKFVQIENAANRGGVGKDAGTFSPNDLAGAIKSGGGRVRSKAYLQGEGLMQDYADQGKNLTDRIPNSGTPERQLVGLGATGAAAKFVSPDTLPILAVIGAAYAPGGRRILKGLMTPRGETATRIGNAVKARARLGGTAGGALAQTSPDQ